MRFAKIVFRIAGIYGIIVLLPQYFTEDKTGRDFPPPITHPEFYYGFVGLALTWQLLFLLLSTDPVRYRLMMIPSMHSSISRNFQSSEVAGSANPSTQCSYLN